MNRETNKAVPREKVTLTDLMRGWAKPIIDPIVTFLARYRLGPDFLTVMGMAFHFLFAWLIAIGQMQWAAVAIFFIGPLDALDGALARKLGRKQGGFGAFLDSTLDRFAEIILFGGFIFYFLDQGDTLLLGLSYIAITGSLMVSYTRARAESLGYESKVGILSRVERYMVITFFLVLNLPEIAVIILAIFTYITTFQRMHTVWKQTR
ncbi:MAG: CDP-alcohol phosphatidyltransferase family protein [Chloroflexi bacterium]|nr:CDP-alcohol phosphatidyltransferase family protein [Chloroflexota bacterium]